MLTRLVLVHKKICWKKFCFVRLLVLLENSSATRLQVLPWTPTPAHFLSDVATTIVNGSQMTIFPSLTYHYYCSTAFVIYCNIRERESGSEAIAPGEKMNWDKQTERHLSRCHDSCSRLDWNYFELCDLVEDLCTREMKHHRLCNFKHSYQIFHLSHKRKIALLWNLLVI